MNGNETITTELAIENAQQLLQHARMLVNLVCCLAAVLGIPANLFVLIAIFYFRVSSLETGFHSSLQRCSSQYYHWIVFLAVCRPTRASVLRTRRAAIAAVVFAWAIVILEITPLFMFVKLIKSSSSPGEGGRHMCLLVTEEDRELDGESAGAERETLFSRKFFTTYTFTLSYLLPLIAIWIFYAKIIRKLWQRRHRMHLKRKMSKRKTTKVTIMGLSIVISYTLCWLPYWLIQWSIALNIGWNRNLSILTCASYAAFALLYINRAVNPFIYVFLSESFKRNVSELVLKNSSVQHKHSNSATVKMLPQQINEGTESV
uniref:G_PROTEIN_RECEP_F1_2 domain-containing protein n=1 Tax=Haemonchus contortus TaxID=6289 RepID=A0A7I4Z4U2_HAECO